MENFHYSTKITPQSQPIPGRDMVKNDAGGYVFGLSDWDRLIRFLILGTAGGTYYASEQKLSVENAECVRRCITEDGLRTVQMIRETSVAGHAPKNDPALFALAMASKLGDRETRKAAFAALPDVARIGTHLFHFAHYREQFGGWGRSMREAVAKWYTNKDIDKLSYQVLKYPQRDGWSHRDLLRLSHPKALTPEHGYLFDWITKGSIENTQPLICAYELAKTAERPASIVRLIRDLGLTREMIPTKWLNDPTVWEALLETMPVGAMVRNLGKMGAVGLLKPLSDSVKTVADRLTDPDIIRKARLHPVQLLSAMMVYGQGHGDLGSLTWTSVPQVMDSLEQGFYNSFEAIQPTGKNHLLALDISSSMSAKIGGLPGMTAAMGAAAMAMATVRTEPNCYTMGFGSDFRDLGISRRSGLDDALRMTRSRTFGSTDCALPMMWAYRNRVPVDTFVIYTDNETWHGSIHPAQALRQYRDTLGINAKVVVVGMTSTGFSIADPADPGMLDVVGFDSSTPAAISEFARLQ